MAIREATTERGIRTRTKLLDSAERCFGNVGYHEATIADITSDAEVALGTFYVHFPSKLEIMVELVESRGHELRQQLHVATKGLSDRASIERAGFSAFLSWVSKRPDIYRVVRNAEYVAPEVFRGWYQRLGAQYIRGLTQAAEKGEIVKADPEAIAYCLMAIGDFTGMRWVLWNDCKQVPNHILEDVMSFVERGLGISKGRRSSTKTKNA